MSTVNPTSTNSAAPKRSPTAPGPGSWSLDASHFERPMTTHFEEVFVPSFRAGITKSMERYGIILEGFGAEIVEGFFYVQPRPLGAPPGGKGPPPKLVFQLLCALHPALRGRLAVAKRAWATKLWREDIARWSDVRTSFMQRMTELQRTDVRALDDAGVARALAAADALFTNSMREHFESSGATFFPVGAFAVAAQKHAGATISETLALLAGAGAGGEDAARKRAAHEALQATPDARAALDDADPHRGVARLRAIAGAAGDALRAWLDVSLGKQLMAGDFDFPIGEEMPHVVLDELRAPPVGMRAAVDPEPLFARAPASQRDALRIAYEDARKGYIVRDDRCAVIDAWSVGLVRRALVETGRRLADKGLLEEPAHAVELTQKEAQALLAGQRVVDAATVAARARARASANIDDMPMFIGPPPGKPPPSAWLPDGARDIHEALFTYLDMMDREDDRPKEATHAKGMGASGGKHIGTARLVLSPSELGKVKRGDVLIARCTMPTYNAVLPLVGGIATDRGGVLSHAAIVSRELGIPGVVGCGDVTKKIPDGARVVIDGDAGTVRVAA